MSRTPPLPALAAGTIVIKPPQLPLLQLQLQLLLQLQLQLQPRSLPAPHVPPTQLLLSDSLPLPLLLLCQPTLQAALVFLKEIIVILLEVGIKSNVNPNTTL